MPDVARCFSLLYELNFWNFFAKRRTKVYYSFCILLISKLLAWRFFNTFFTYETIWWVRLALQIFLLFRSRTFRPRSHFNYRTWYTGADYTVVQIKKIWKMGTIFKCLLNTIFTMFYLARFRRCLLFCPDRSCIALR